MRNLIFVGGMTIPEIRDMLLNDHATHGSGSYEAKSFRIQNLGRGGLLVRALFSSRVARTPKQAAYLHVMLVQRV